MVLGCERRSTLKLQDPRTTPSKICKIDDHVLLSFAGLNADSRILIDQARVEAQSHKLSLDDPVSIDYITRYIAGVQQKYTQSGGVRPFGLLTLVAGFDVNDTVPKLYQTEPSGVFSSWKAISIGKNLKTVREFLEKHYTEGLGEEETVFLTIKALLEVVQTGAKNIEVCVMSPGVVKRLSNDEIKEYVEKIEQEKKEESEKRKPKK